MDSDPEIEFVEKDSGMSSLGGSKDETPERKPEIEDIDDDLEVEAVRIAVAEQMKGYDDEDNDNEVAVVSNVVAEKTENYDDEPDETLTERVWGLTEMFPQPLRKVCGVLTEFGVNSTKGLYKFTCTASWIFFTSSVILYAPVLFESERAQMEELQRSQQKQVLLGPGSAIGGSPGLPAMPPLPASR